MKKLLVLMLVFGMVSVANADLVPPDLKYDYLSPPTLTVDGTIAYDLYVIVTSDGTLTPLNNTAIGPNAPSMSGYFVDVAWDDSMFGAVLPIPSGHLGGSWVFASTVGETYEYGNYLTLNLPGSEVGAWWYEEGTQEWGEIPEVPEPMTMSLLGLGGLFLRRRRSK